jgi:hypothetical protein
VWQKLAWLHTANATQCLQLLAGGKGQLNIDDAFLSVQE